ncbi:MAG: malate synthase A [Bauldia sp.]|nr:malate synthase A [Bauldia sp.]
MSASPAIVAGPGGPRHDEILTPDALAFLGALHARFEPARQQLLAHRDERQAEFDAGRPPDFLPETAHIRAAEWTVPPVPAEITDRRVEITGPSDRKMLINGLNAGARVCMSDFEDAVSPTWTNIVDGQLNLFDRWRDRLDFTDAATGKAYSVGPNPAVLMVRARGLHLPEVHIAVDGEAIAGGLFDLGAYVFHNAAAILAKRSQPYVYLSKIESHQEARWWNEVLSFIEAACGLAPGTIKATVLIETITAAFEIDEIIYELRDHMAGVNCGRWDYIFSFIKTFRAHAAFLLPDRSQLSMDDAFLAAYSELAIKTCHRRGTFAIGGMSAFIPVRKDPEANRKALDAVRADKEREARIGHDGTWVAHPDLVPVVMEVFDRLMPGPNQLDRNHDDIVITQDRLLEVHDGTRSLEGLRENIRVGVQYVEAWLRGRGAVPLYNMMEDASTAEISRAQIWQQLRFGGSMTSGQRASVALFETCLAEEMARVKDEIGEEAFASGRFREAIALFRELATEKVIEPFFTAKAYPLIA